MYHAHASSCQDPVPRREYLSRDRERDWHCGRAWRAAGEPKRGRVWTHPKRTCRLLRGQSAG